MKNLRLSTIFLQHFIVYGVSGTQVFAVSLSNCLVSCFIQYFKNFTQDFLHYSNR